MAIAINGAGTITGISSGGLPDGVVTVDDLSTTGTKSSDTFLSGTGAWAAAGGGKVLQCVQTVVVSKETSTTNDWVDISGFTVTTGTLASTSSKILLIVHAHAGQSSSQGILMRFLRGSTVIYVGTGAADNNSNWNATLFGSYNSSTSDAISSDTGVFLDVGPSAPGFADTSALTYKVQWRTISGTVYLNTNSGGNYGEMPSSITAIEIGA